ncbi:hypothetical protein BDZ45DRAFT_678318 [Acephala macrosclerotiorum]|nr:hypothetical protein BDZ45DRAFT_678318 [Acephala macrosclerotiorum]
MDRHEYNVERQSEEEDVLEADRFLAGFFAGLAAAKTYANTTANTSVPDAGALALDDPNTRWPFQDGLAPTPPSNISAPWSHPLSQINGTSSSQAQNISLDHEPHRFYAVQLDAITTSAVDKHLFDFNSTVTAYPPPLNDYRWSHISDGAANSLESQSSFVLEGDVPRNWLSSSDIAASQHNASTLSEPRLLPAELSETLDTPPRSTTDPDPALNNPNWHEFSTTDALIQIGNTFGASTRSPREATPNRQAPEWSLPHVARRLKHTKSSPHSVSAVAMRDETRRAGCHSDGIPSLWFTKVQAQRAIEGLYCHD